MTSSSSTILLKHLKHQCDWTAGCGRMGGASEAHDVVEVTRFSSETPGTAEQSRCGPYLLIRLLIGRRTALRRLHWTVGHLELCLQTEPLRFGVARLRLQTSLLHGVRALHASS